MYTFSITIMFISNIVEHISNIVVYTITMSLPTH